jgi:Zn finger protein HypA/HybF involved in hydrogenase expression
MGEKLARVDVRCSCGEWFSRSIAHPYIVLCPKCRKGRPLVSASREDRTFLRRVRCPECREMLKTDSRLGMRSCPRCRAQWWAMPGGWWRNWDTDEQFRNGKYLGSLREETFRQVVARA